MCCNIHTTAQHLFSVRLLVTIKSKGQSVRGENLFAHHQSFLLHPPVLKPYFYLLVTQVQSVWQLLSFLSVDEFIHHKFILKFSQLWLRVRLSLLSGFHLWRAPWGTWREQKQVWYFKLNFSHNDRNCKELSAPNCISVADILQKWKWFNNIVNNRSHACCTYRKMELILPWTHSRLYKDIMRILK